MVLNIIRSLIKNPTHINLRREEHVKDVSIHLTDLELEIPSFVENIFDAQ